MSLVAFLVVWQLLFKKFRLNQFELKLDYVKCQSVMFETRGQLSCLTKMNIAQVTACQPGISGKNISRLHKLHSKSYGLPNSFGPCSCALLTVRARQSFGLKCWPISQSRKPLHICLAGEKGMMGNDDEVLHIILTFALVCCCQNVITC